MDVRDSVRSFLSELMRESGYVGELADDESLVEAGILDSLSILMLLAYLSETFGIALDADALDPKALDTVEAVVAFVEARSPARSAT